MEKCVFHPPIIHPSSIISHPSWWAVGYWFHSGLNSYINSNMSSLFMIVLGFKALLRVVAEIEGYI